MRRPCCDKEGRNRGAWSKQEDQKLIDYINTHGDGGGWHSLPKAAGLDRCGKSCRLRWINYLRPNIKRGNFTPDEEDLIIKLHALLGNRWSLIAGRLPGRTDNEVKNYWNSHIRKKLIGMGIDPNNHKLQHIPKPQIKLHSVSPTAASCESKRHDIFNSKPPLESQACGVDSIDQGLSHNSAISCMEEEVSPVWDLNLNLTIAMPLNKPTPRRVLVSENSAIKSDLEKGSTNIQMENAHPLILPLFK